MIVQGFDDLAGVLVGEASRRSSPGSNSIGRESSLTWSLMAHLFRSAARGRWRGADEADQSTSADDGKSNGLLTVAWHGVEFRRSRELRARSRGSMRSNPHTVKRRTCAAAEFIGGLRPGEFAGSYGASSENFARSYRPHRSRDRRIARHRTCGGSRTCGGGGWWIALARTQGALEQLDDEVRALGSEGGAGPMRREGLSALDRLGAAIYERWGRNWMFL